MNLFVLHGCILTSLANLNKIKTKLMPNRIISSSSSKMLDVKIPLIMPILLVFFPSPFISRLQPMDDNSNETLTSIQKKLRKLNNLQQKVKKMQKNTEQLRLDIGQSLMTAEIAMGSASFAKWISSNCSAHQEAIMRIIWIINEQNTSNECTNEYPKGYPCSDKAYCHCDECRQTDNDNIDGPPMNSVQSMTINKELTNTAQQDIHDDDENDDQ